MSTDGVDGIYIGFADVILSTANITVTDNVDKSEADTIDAYSNTSGTVTLTSITDTVSNVTAVENNANISLDTSTITVTDAATLVNANAINNFTSAQVTLNVVEDTVSNITSIDGLTTSEVSMGAAAVTVTDAATLANKVLSKEHQIYPLAARWFAEGRLSLVASKAVLDEQELPQHGVIFNEH